jgi:hypothetical protein
VTPGGPGGQKEGPPQPRTNGDRIKWLGPLIPFSLVVVGAPYTLQAPLNIYDGGLLLTLARFTSLSTLPYRDLWTLYGPGPPLLGSISTHLFGRGVLVVQIVHIMIQVALVLGVYFLVRRFVHTWVAVLLTVPIASFAYSPNHFHFSMSLSLLVWGMWLLSSMAKSGQSKRVAVAGLLIGLSFLGRYEYVLFAPLLIAGIWWFIRPWLGEQAARSFLVTGLLPPSIFVIYLLAVVGWDRSYLNLVEYPLRFYSEPFCRGVPTPWGAAFEDLTAPLRGHLWTANGLVLGIGTFATPVVALGCLLVGLRHGPRRDGDTALILVCVALALLTWLEMRPRAGGEPHPTWVFTLVCTSILLARSQRRSSLAALAVGGILVVFVSVLIASWFPERVSAWAQWPPYDRVTGFAAHPPGSLNDRRAWDSVAGAVHRYAAPGERILVALNENRGHFANAPIFYWYVDRPPATRFIEFDPCLTDTEPIQRMIVQDLKGTNVIITTTFFPQAAPQFAEPALSLDRYLTRHFRSVFEAEFPPPEPEAFPQRVAVLVRRTGALGDQLSTVPGTESSLPQALRAHDTVALSP